MLRTSLIFVEFVEGLYSLSGERPPAVLNIRYGRRSCASICPITREGGVITDTGILWILVRFL